LGASSCPGVLRGTMRIVHDINSKAEVCLGASLTPVRRGEHMARSMKVRLTFLTEDVFTKAPEDIHLEGDAAYILHALREAIAQIEECGQTYVNDGDLQPAWQEKAHALRPKRAPRPSARPRGV